MRVLMARLVVARDNLLNTFLSWTSSGHLRDTRLVQLLVFRLLLALHTSMVSSFARLGFLFRRNGVRRTRVIRALLKCLFLLHAR